ncbi:esterase-like activity of phytase family protein [Ignatzschineria sp. LJL83]
MFRRSLIVTSLLVSSIALSDQEYPATLSAHAYLPANTMIKAPSDAPKDLQVSGKFTDGIRNNVVGSVEGTSQGRPTGLSLPFEGQPIQGHSGIKRMEDGSYWLLTDNGAGSKANSSDFMLYLNQYDVDFENNAFALLNTIFLKDPAQKVPFRIQNEGTTERYLTGADFDPESFQFAGGYLWVGDEFGPYLLQVTMDGEIVNVFETSFQGNTLRSPDHYTMIVPGNPAQKSEFEVLRSKGFEGMAVSADGTKLYPLLEGALVGTDGSALQILEFDVKNQNWTGNFWNYPLAKKGLSIGDFNMIDDEYALIIERDNGEGVVEFACQGDVTPTCFDTANLPEIKRVYKIKMNGDNQNQNVEKIGYIDLLNIQDPNQVARKELSSGNFVFPFFTIENVDIVDAETIIVGNDNNLPFSSSRAPNKADDNELVLLNVAELLQAK